MSLREGPGLASFQKAVTCAELTLAAGLTLYSLCAALSSFPQELGIMQGVCAPWNPGTVQPEHTLVSDKPVLLVY